MAVVPVDQWNGEYRAGERDQLKQVNRKELTVAVCVKIEKSANNTYRHAEKENVEIPEFSLILFAVYMHDICDDDGHRSILDSEEYGNDHKEEDRAVLEPFIRQLVVNDKYAYDIEHGERTREILTEIRLTRQEVVIENVVRETAEDRQYNEAEHVLEYTSCVLDAFADDQAEDRNG